MQKLVVRPYAAQREHAGVLQPVAVSFRARKAFTAWMMLNASTERAASAFARRRPRVNLPPPV